MTSRERRGGNGTAENSIYRVVADGDWFLVVRDEGRSSRVLARYLDEFEANRVRAACEQATSGDSPRP